MQNDDPNIFKHSVDMLSLGADSGAIYNFRVRAFTEAGIISSNYKQVAFAALPS
jgi:hypothetical protein